MNKINSNEEQATLSTKSQFDINAIDNYQEDVYINSGCSENNGDSKTQSNVVVKNNCKEYAGFKVPNGYVIYSELKKDSHDIRGIYKMPQATTEPENESEDGKPKYGPLICDTPCIITGRSTNVDSGKYYVELTINDIDRGDFSIWELKSTLFTRNGLRKLIDYGLNVDDNQLTDFMPYLRKSYSFNEHILPISITADKNGWKNNYEYIVVGNTGYYKSKKAKVRMLDEGAAKHLHAKGSLDNWKNGVGKTLSRPLTRFKCYGAAAAPLIGLLAGENFIIDHFGRSGISKTSTTDIAFSMFGNPTDMGLKNDGVNTVVAVERISARYCDLPIYFDETTNIPKDVIKFIIYMIANGKGKGRGKKDGSVEEGAHWNTVCFTTGEKPLISLDSNEGEKQRVISLDESLPNDIADEIDLAKDTVKLNYGHFTELYIKKIFEHKDELKDMFNECKKRITESTNNHENRSANKFAIMNVAGILLEKVFADVGIEACNPNNIIDEYFQKIILSNPIESPAKIMLQHFMDWKNARNDYFVKYSSKKQIHPYNKSEIYGWETPLHIDVNRDALENALRKYDNGNLDIIYKEWKMKTILFTDGGHTEDGSGRKTKTVKHKVDGVLKKHTVIRFNKIKLEKELGIYLSKDEME